MDDVENTLSAQKTAGSWERILENSFNEIYLFDAKHLKFLQVSKGVLHNLGYTLEELQKLTPLDLKLDFTKKTFDETIEPLLKGKQNLVVFTTRHQRKDRSLYPVEIRLQLVSENDPPFFIAISNDLSERNEASEALRTSQDLYAEAQRIARIGSCELDLVNNTIYWSDEIYRILEIERKEATTCLETFLAAIHPDDRDRFSGAHAKGIEEKRAYDILYRMLMKDGRIKYIHQYCEPSCDENGKVIRVIHTVQDVTQFHKTELALQKLNRSLKALSACNEAVMRITDEAELLNKVCNIIVTLAGYPLAWVGFLEHDKDKSVHPKAFAGNDPGFLATLKVSWGNDIHGQNPTGAAIRTGVADCVQHMTTKQPDGPPWRESAVRHGYRSMVALPLIEKEEVFGALNIYAAEADAFDEEEVQLLQKLADNLAFGLRTLRAQSEHTHLQRQLEQSQKMEAIGQLAGGIAHDYNNWLGIIMGYLDFLKDHLAGTEEPSKWVRAAIKAAQHSANLTRKLLVFARQHPTTKSVTDINKVIREIGDLIESSVTPEVEVDYLLDETLWRVEVDTNELNDAILNLVSNARSAMPNGGKLIIETMNRVLEKNNIAMNPGIVPGDYVLLSISDTGRGMTKAIQSRIFEPFFTTKSKEKGTGLGLSMVYGFVKRHSGYSTVYSEPDLGTTFHVFLPRALEHEKIEVIEPSDPVSMPTGNETILVVDDEVELLYLVDKYLSDLGYKTLLAENATQGLDIILNRNKIDLLFSDVVMPGGINGYELAQKAIKLRPTLKVLLTSGFSPKTAERDGSTRFTKNLLTKPYHKAELAQRVRLVLDLEENV